MIVQIRDNEVMMTPESDDEKLIIEKMADNECYIKPIYNNCIRIEIEQPDKNSYHA